MEIDKVGIDLGKSVFHLAGLSVTGATVVRKKFSRLQLLRFTANLQVRVIGREACGGAHFLGRALRDQGHDVRLMPAQYVKPYVKTNKNDYIDAEAIAEAVDRPRMRYGWRRNFRRALPQRPGPRDSKAVVPRWRTHRHCSTSCVLNS